jgi:outer membrane receptor protein involved in Fe transport
VQWSPRVWLDLFASYGEGYRSPQARQLEEGENAPFAKVRSLEAGLQIAPVTGKFELTAAAYRTDLSVDLAFDPGEGRLERIGPTTRQGSVVHLIARPLDGAVASLSLTYVHATLDAPPPATAENPTPPFEAGELLPYVPPLLARGDATIVRKIATLAGKDVRARIGADATYLSPRPLPFGRFGDPVFLLDAAATIEWRELALSLEIGNVLDAQYAASEYSFVSDWGTREIPSLLPARHFAAGPPRTMALSLEVRL